MATALDSIIDGVREDLALRKTKPNDFDENNYIIFHLCYIFIFKIVVYLNI